MVVDQVDALAGRHTGIKAQAGLYVLCGILESSVYACLLPIIRGLLAGQITEMLPWIIAAVILALACALLMYAVDNHGYLIGDKVVLRSIQDRLGNHLVKLPLGWFTKERSGQLSTLMERDLQMVMNLPGMFLRDLVFSVTVPVCITILYFMVDWRLALSFAVFAPLLWIGAKSMGAAAGDGHLVEEKSNALLTSRVLEFVRAQPILRATGATQKGWNALQKDIERDRKATVDTLDMVARPMGLYTMLVYLAFGTVLATSTALLAIKAVTVAGYIFVIILALRFIEALIKIGSQGMTFRVCQNALNATEKILAEKPLSEPENPKEPHGSEVRFDHLRFSYDGTHTVLDDVTLSCPERSITALVGPSGSGKTTLTRLAARFWDVDGGSVSIGGVDVRDMNADVLLQQVSLVFQDVYLFDGTIEDNIRFGFPNATDEQVRHVARIARLDEVAKRLEHGWDSLVGEGGRRLSGGEAQRVSIARALLKDAPVVLFDEATAALDAENEAAVVSAMHELARNRTVIVIAHRLSTIAEADQIAMLENGRITQLGAHEELLAEEGRYRVFWQERERAQGWHIAKS